MTRIPALLLVMTVVISGLLGYCLLATQPSDLHGGTHPRFPEMNQGGTAERHTNLIIIGGLYGVLQIAVFVTGLCLGIRRDRSRLFPLVLGGAAYAAVFMAMVIAYLRGMDNAPVVFGFPVATAIMIFGMWTIPIVFVLMYIVRFRQWVFNTADAQQFDELKARFQSQHRPGGRQEPTDG